MKIDKKQLIQEIKALKKDIRKIEIAKGVYTFSLMDQAWNEAIEAVINILREY